MYRLTNRQAGLSEQLKEHDFLFNQLLKDPTQHKEMGAVFEKVKDTAKKLCDAFTCNLHSLNKTKRTAKRRSWLEAHIEHIERRLQDYDVTYQNYLASAGSFINSTSAAVEDDIEDDRTVSDHGSKTASYASTTSSKRSLIQKQMQAELDALAAAEEAKAIEAEAAKKKALSLAEFKLKQAEIIKSYTDRALSVRSSRSGSKRSSQRPCTSKGKTPIDKTLPKDTDKHVTFSKSNTVPKQLHSTRNELENTASSKFLQRQSQNTFVNDVKPFVTLGNPKNSSTSYVQPQFNNFARNIKPEPHDTFSDVSYFLKAHSLNAPNDSYTMNTANNKTFRKTSSPRDTEYEQSYCPNSRSSYLYEQPRDQQLSNDFQGPTQSDAINFAKLFRNSLEKPPTVKFDGSLTSFYSFISVYEEDVLSKWGETDPGYCLNYLLDSCTGQAYDAISTCRLIKPKSAGLKEALSNLYSLYSSPERIERAHEQDVISGDSVKDNFKSLSDYLIVLNNHNIVLQGTDNNKRYGKKPYPSLRYLR